MFVDQLTHAGLYVLHDFCSTFAASKVTGEGIEVIVGCIKCILIDREGIAPEVDVDRFIHFIVVVFAK